ncbi:restriction endonuclease subunit S [Rhodohalobacter sp. 8-1]|uniref:restriction endonuclease subunit S n=1 Tax=Rhodohalobacter sp. 8-1 TaxID=3131972 RepID=UPI0030EC0C0B
MRDLRTEIPDGWNEKKLHSVIKDLSAGVSVNSGDRPADKNEIGVLKTSSLKKGCFIATENKVIIKEEEKERSKRTPKAGTILVSRMNTPDLVGEIAYVDKDYPNLYLPDRIWITEGINADEVNAKWLSYKLISPEVKHNLKSIATGTSGSMKNITQNDFLKLPVAFPPKHEQDQIVNIIEKWDEAISNVDNLIKAKKQYKKGLMQRLLSGKMRFPEFEGEDWVEVKLGDIAEVISSNLDKKIKEGQEDVRLCNYMDVYDNAVIDSSISFMESTASEREIEKYTLKEDDVIITKDSETADDIANAAVVKNLESRVLCGYHLAIIRPNREKVLGDFLAKQIMTFAYRKQLFQMANGATRYGLRISDIENAKFHIPSLKEQKKISSFINCNNKEISLLIEEKQAFETQKKGLMQKLLTGKVRVKNMN